VTAVGIGSNLIRRDLIQAGDYAAMTANVTQVIAWIREARGK